MSKQYTIYLEDEAVSLLTLTATLSPEAIKQFKAALKELVQQAEL